jgi:hypothetical protein
MLPWGLPHRAHQRTHIATMVVDSGAQAWCPLFEQPEQARPVGAIAAPPAGSA